MTTAPRSHSRRLEYRLAALLAVGGLLALAWNHFRTPEVPEEQPSSESRAAVREADERGPLSLTLTRCWNGFWGDERSQQVQLDIVNQSDRPVRFWFNTSPMYHVTFVVRNRNNDHVGDFYFGTLSSNMVFLDDTTGRPKSNASEMTLQPGEAFTRTVYLWIIRDHCTGPKVSGRYRLEALFAYTDLGEVPERDRHYLARSAALLLDIDTGESDAKQPTWHLRSGG